MPERRFWGKARPPAATYVVLDGAAIMQMLKSTAPKNFDEYASQLFIPSWELSYATQHDLS